MFVTIVRLGVRQMDNSGVCCTGMTFYARSVTSGNIETQFSSGMDFASLSCRSKLILTFRLVAVQRGVAMAQCYEMLEQEAKEAGFALHWPRHLPNTRRALAAAEWARQHQPQAFSRVRRTSLSKVRTPRRCSANAVFAANYLCFRYAFLSASVSERCFARSA